MWKWAPAESPSKMIPLGCEPRKHNLFTLFMYSSSGQPPEWVAITADSLVCIQCTVQPNSDTLPLFVCWRVWGERLGAEWNVSAAGTASWAAQTQVCFLAQCKSNCCTTSRVNDGWTQKLDLIWVQKYVLNFGSGNGFLRECTDSLQEVMTSWSNFDSLKMWWSL